MSIIIIASVKSVVLNFFSEFSLSRHSVILVANGRIVNLAY